MITPILFILAITSVCFTGFLLLNFVNNKKNLLPVYWRTVPPLKIHLPPSPSKNTHSFSRFWVSESHQNNSADSAKKSNPFFAFKSPNSNLDFLTHTLQNIDNFSLHSKMKKEGKDDRVLLNEIQIEPTNLKSDVEIERKLEDLKASKGLEEPDRGDLDDTSIEWRFGKPHYARANLAFLKGKSQNHLAGSLERVVENLVKTWEMEASHKNDFSQWTTVDTNGYDYQTNGGEILNGKDVKEIGNYNGILKECPKFKDKKDMSFEDSHHLFQNVFGGVFPWEVLEVRRGPPICLFSWRHWGYFEGEYDGNKGKGQLVEAFGVCRVTLKKVENSNKGGIQRVQDDWKISKLQIFLDSDSFIGTLEGEKKTDSKGKDQILEDMWKKAMEAEEKD